MWIVAVFLWVVLYSGTRAAFECAGMTLPSTLVICSDPELMRLADERQEAINEARGRVGEEAWPALWENQKAWVRSYATACGVPPDRPLSFPVSASIRACFKQAPSRASPICGHMALAPGLRLYCRQGALAAIASARATTATRLAIRSRF